MSQSQQFATSQNPWFIILIFVTLLEMAIIFLNFHLKSSVILLPNENPSFCLFLFPFAVVKIINRSYGYASPSLRLAHNFRCVVPRQRKK